MTPLRVVSAAAPERARSRFEATARPVRFAGGFHDEEVGEGGRFRWMGLAGRVTFEPAGEPGFLEGRVFSEFHDLSQTLWVDAGGGESTLRLLRGWTRVSVPVGATSAGAELRADKLFPPQYYPGDERELAVRLRPPILHADPERHRQVTRQRANAVRNTEELLSGATHLESTPRRLGIDVFGGCNVKPPCVYCEWDEAKRLEGGNVDAPFDLGTLEGYGRFFANSQSVVNCSIGEPFLMKRLDRVFERCGETGKRLEITTNGQVLTDRIIGGLLGREIELYVSLDAATAATYARLRNARWQTVLANLRRLIAAKGGRAGLPSVSLVFMPMRANLHELEAFVRLCAELDTDRMVLRPLNYSDSVDLVWERGGYRFDYRHELLPFDELVEASARAARLCAEHGVRLADQMEFEAPPAEVRPSDPPVPRPEAPPVVPPPPLGDDKLPPCLEPWTDLYILRRGILPCSYGGKPIAPLEGFREAWNSPPLLEIRAKLAAGEFPEYCYRSPACPIVRKAMHGRRLPLRRRLFFAARRVYLGADRRLFGLPGRIYRPLRDGHRAARAWLGHRRRA